MSKNKNAKKSELLSEIDGLSRSKQHAYIKEYINKSRDPMSDLLNKKRMIPIIVDSLSKADHRRMLEKFARTNQERYLKALKKDALGSIVAKEQKRVVLKSRSTSAPAKKRIRSTRQIKKKPTSKKIKKLDSNGSVMTAVDFGDLPDIKSFFFNKGMHADETNANFMKDFNNIHNQEKARSSIAGPSVIKMSMPRLSKLFSEPGVAMSVPRPQQMRVISQSIGKELEAIKSGSGSKAPLQSKALLTRYLIQSRSDLDTWVRIIIPANDNTKKLQEALEKADRSGVYPSDGDLKERLDKLKGIFSGLDFDGIKTSPQKCKILENEINISRSRNMSYEFRTAVYVLYKLLNCTKPHIKLG